MNALVFLQVSQAQKSKVLDILRAAAESLQEKGIPQWQYWMNPPKIKLDWIDDGLASQQFYFISKDESIIGLIRIMEEDLLYWGTQETAAFYIHSLVILPEYSGLSYGNQVILQVEEMARTKEISILRLDCFADNQKLCSYYKNQGFQEVRTIQMPLSKNMLFEKHI